MLRSCVLSFIFYVFPYNSAHNRQFSYVEVLSVVDEEYFTIMLFFQSNGELQYIIVVVQSIL